MRSIKVREGMAGNGLVLNGTGDSCCCSRCEDEKSPLLFTICSWVASMVGADGRGRQVKQNAPTKRDGRADANIINRHAKCSLDGRPSIIGTPLEMDGPERRRRFDFVICQSPPGGQRLAYLAAFEHMTMQCMNAEK